MSDKNYDLAVAEMSAAYTAYKAVAHSVTFEVREKYRRLMNAEIEQRKFDAAKTFADVVARVKERDGVPLDVIQRHVLHTKNWNTWERFRDLADIPPERVSAAGAKQAREKDNSPFVWNDDYTELTVSSYRGVPLQQPVTFDMGRSRVEVTGRYRVLAIPEHIGRDVTVAKATGDYLGFYDMVEREIVRQVKAGNVVVGGGQ